MRTPRLAACVVALGIAAASAAQIPNITTTPSHTPTPTPTVTATGTRTPTPSPTAIPTPWLSGSAEFAITAEIPVAQSTSALTNAPGGGFVVTWASAHDAGGDGGIVARRYDRHGAPLDFEFPVNTVTTGHQYGPAIDGDLAGNFVVAWSGPDASGRTDVFARRFGSDGTPLGGEFPVNSYTTGRQYGPRVLKSPGGFLVVWSSVPDPPEPPQDGDQGGIYGRLFDDAGQPVAGEFRINTTTTGDQRGVALSGDALGNAVVAWESTDGDDAGIYGQLFDSSGARIGSEFRANTQTLGSQSLPDVAGSPSQFVVVWTSQGQDGSGAGVFGRAFRMDFGQPEFQVNSHTELGQGRARVAMDPGHGFLVTWQSFGQDDPGAPSSGGIFAQRYDNAPFPTSQLALTQPRRRGAEYQVNATATGSQSLPDVVDGVAGRFVVSWDGPTRYGSGVFARRFHHPGAISAAVDATAGGGTSNLNGVLEPGERVRVAPAWWNNHGTSAMSLAAAATSITGPAGPTYAIPDPAADYGTLAPRAVEDCETATGDCYEVTVSGPRPAVHWDATFDERTAVPGVGLPVTKTWALHVGGSFADAPTDAFYSSIETILHNGITAGGGCGSGLFCGEDGVLRQQMAVFLVKSARGPGFEPPPASGAVFDDVPASNPFAAWIEELSRMGVTAGCTASPPPALPSYCPTDVVNRQQMAAFLLKSLYGGQYGGSGVCEGFFEDVPCSNPSANWIEALYGFGIAAGCQAEPLLYCPTAPTKRKQMAVFLVKAFGLELYGPD